MCYKKSAVEGYRRVLWIAGNPDAWGVGNTGFVLLWWGLIKVKGVVFGWLGVWGVGGGGWGVGGWGGGGWGVGVF